MRFSKEPSGGALAWGLLRFDRGSRAHRRLRGAAPFAITFEERGEHQLHEREAAHGVVFGKTLHYREREKNIGERFRVAETGGRFRVVFRELQRIRQKEGVETRSGAGGGVARVDAREAFFIGAESGLREQARIGERLLHDAFAKRGDGLGDGANALLVRGSEKKRAQKQAVDTLAEREAFGAHARIQLG